MVSLMAVCLTAHDGIIPWKLFQMATTVPDGKIQATIKGKKRKSERKGNDLAEINICTITHFLLSLIGTG